MNRVTAETSLLRRFMEAGKHSAPGYAAQVAAENARKNETPSGSGSSAEDAQSTVACEPPGPLTPGPSPPQSRGRGELRDVPQRYVLRAQPVPVHQRLKHAVRFHGVCLVVGENPTVEAL